MPADKKILIIDDDESLVREISDFLKRKYDVEVLSALKGEEGISSIISNKPDIVILDVMLPEKDGFAICEDIRKLDPAERPIIILLTMLTSFLDKMEAGWRQKTGARALLPKPVNMSKLAEIIDDIIDS